MKYTDTIFLTVALLVASAYAEDPWTPSPLCPFPSEDLTRFPYEGNCSRYWECYEGARYPMDCPAGLEFNDEVKRCDDPTVANCDPDATISYPTFSHSTVTTQSTSPTPDPGPLPECPFPSDELTFFPVVNNCSQYWECFQGNRYLMNCPSGLFWNTEHNYCDFAENVDCSLNNSTTTKAPGGSTTTPGTTDTTGPWTPDPQCPWPSDELTFFPHPTNCSEYYECYEGNKFLMSCPDGLFWNDLADICDYKENVDCNRTTSIPVSTTPGTGTTLEPNTTSPSTDITTNSTDTTANPTTVTVTTGVPVSTTTFNPICQDEPDGTYLPHPTDCSKFYECAAGKASEEQCPGNLLWNQEAHTCDYPEHVDCDDSAIH